MKGNWECKFKELFRKETNSLPLSTYSHCLKCFLLELGVIMCPLTADGSRQVRTQT